MNDGFLISSSNRQEVSFIRNSSSCFNLNKDVVELWLVCGITVYMCWNNLLLLFNKLYMPIWSPCAITLNREPKNTS